MDERPHSSPWIAAVARAEALRAVAEHERRHHEERSRLSVIGRDRDENNPPESPIPPSPFRVRCGRCGTLYVGECHVCLRQQLAGAVGTLVRIATRDYDPLQHESPGSLAREALAAMGVDPATYRGQ